MAQARRMKADEGGEPQRHPTVPDDSGYPERFPPLQSGYPPPAYPRPGYGADAMPPHTVRMQGRPRDPSNIRESGVHPADGPSSEASDVHPADLDGATLVRPTYGIHDAVLSAGPSSAPTRHAPAETEVLAHNDTIIATSPFVDLFPGSRAPLRNPNLEETKVQTVDIGVFSQTIAAGPPLMSSVTPPSNTQVASLPPAAPAAPSKAPAFVARPSPMPVRRPAINDLRAQSRVSEVQIRTMKRPRDRHAVRFGAGLTILLGLAAIAIATAFNVIFVNLPVSNGVISRLWYLTTALAFAGFGFGAGSFTRSSKPFVVVSAIFVAGVYGAADLGMQSLVEGLALTTAAFLSVQGVVIALVCGIGSAFTGFANRHA